MNGKLLITFIVLAGTILSTCGRQPVDETSTPAAAETLILPVTGATATEAPETAEPVTLTIVPDFTSTVPDFTSTPEPSATSEPTRPPNAADCTNSASFVADVTIPDKSEVLGGETIIKTWRVTNTGTCIWGSDYTLTHYSKEFLNAPAAVPLSVTYPGQTADISIPLKAPNSIGTHEGYFVIKNPAGLIMKINSDSRLWVIINVKNMVTTTPIVTGTANTPGVTASSDESGFVKVICAYTTDQVRLTQVANAVNAYRAQFGLTAYIVNSQMARAAQAHANDMACNQLFGHAGSDGSTPQSRIAASGYIAEFATENVYGSYPPLSPQEVVKWWINDQTDTRHRLNLVSDTYLEIGVGYAFFNNFGYYVIVFASP